ncbi:unnamed protein product, partial [Pylaiella littoralis]
SLSGIDITWFVPVGNAVSISVEDQFDLACSSVVTFLRYDGSRGDDFGADARCDARLAPLEAAMDRARKGFRAALRRLQDVLEDRRLSIASFPTQGFRAWGEVLALWIFRFSALPNPPESFSVF